MRLARRAFRVEIAPLRLTEPDEHKLLCGELDEALRLVEFAGGVSVWVDWDEVLMGVQGDMGQEPSVMT